ncbi:MAG: hypothetical protein RR248_03765 [Clostridia bacterium]
MFTPYIVIISTSLLTIFGLNWLLGSYSVWYCLILTLLNFVLVVGVDGLFAFLIHSLPMRFFSPYKKFFKTNSAELKFYEFTRIKRWKDYVMELDGLGSFKKNKIDTTDPSYLLRFLQENCCGEIIHYFCLISGLANLIFLNYSFLTISLPIVIINAILNIPPIFIQRYNRPKLLRIYEIKSKRFENISVWECNK